MILPDLRWDWNWQGSLHDRPTEPYLLGHRKVHFVL